MTSKMQNRFIFLTSINQSIMRFISLTVKYGFPSPVTKVYMVRRVTAPLTINLDTSWEWSTSRSSRFIL